MFPSSFFLLFQPSRLKEIHHVPETIQDIEIFVFQIYLEIKLQRFCYF